MSSLDQLWPFGLDERTELILYLRLNETLEMTGDQVGLSRERVRQLEKKAREYLAAALRRELPDSVRALDEMLAGKLAVEDAQIRGLLPSSEEYRRLISLAVLDVQRASAWGAPVAGWSSRRPKELQEALRSLAMAAPFPDSELRQRGAATGLPQSFPAASALASAGSPVRRHPNGPWWVRRQSTQRDAAYLWLIEQGEPKTLIEIAGRLEVAENAIRERLRHDERFVQLRPAGTWALAEWNLLAGKGPRNALEAVLSILGARGPLLYEELLREMGSIYPVTGWRVSQCLTSELIGEMPDGRVGLVADGAVLVEEAEPPKPSNVAVSSDGQLVATKVVVDHDLLRGSGVALPRYVGWAVGLRHAPQSRSFMVAKSEEALTVTKQLGMLQVSALRRFAVPLGVTEGCVLVLMLRLDEDRADLVHGCQLNKCPANKAED